MTRIAIARRVGLLGCVAIGIVILGAGPSGRAPAVRVVDMLDRCDRIRSTTCTARAPACSITPASASTRS